MQSTYIDGAPTFLAGEDLAEHRRVKMKSGTTTTPPEVVYADAGEDCLGITLDGAELGESVAIATLGKPGTFLAEAGAAFALGADLYGAADGKVSGAASGHAYFKALQAASGDESVVEIMVNPVLSTTASTVSIDDAGTFTDETTTEGALQEIYQHLKSAQAMISIPLGAITQEDGTPLGKLSGTTSGFSQQADKELVIEIPVNATVEALGFSVPVPMDLDDSADVTVHVLAGKDADNDSLSLGCEVYPVAVGDTANANIQDTAAQAITQGAGELVFTCGPDGVLAGPGALTGILSLSGTNDGDSVYVYGVWIEYSRKLLTA